MFKSLGVSAQLIVVAAQAAAFAQSNQPDTPEEIEEIVVTGVLPGPPLWKVTNGEHALWILPLVNLYPKKMEWESDRVERLIAGSQEFIAMPYAGRITATANPIAIIRLMGVYKETTHLQDGKRLADILPPEIYQRYLKLKALHFPNDDQIDKLTAREAGKRMQQEILDDENLEQLSYANPSSPAVIMDSLYKWLKRNKTIRRTSTSHLVVDALKSNEVKAGREEAVAVMSSDSHREFEVACLAAKIAYFENDFELAKKRANAWAQGDADELIRHATALKNDVALQSLRGPCRMLSASDDAIDLEKISHEKWLAAVATALTNNERTFAVLGINDILDPNGLITKLQAKGYAIEVSR
jgi:hypothetical protein